MKVNSGSVMVLWMNILTATSKNERLGISLTMGKQATASNILLYMSKCCKLTLRVRIVEFSIHEVLMYSLFNVLLTPIALVAPILLYHLELGCSNTNILNNKNIVECYVLYVFRFITSKVLRLPSWFDKLLYVSQMFRLS